MRTSIAAAAALACSAGIARADVPRCANTDANVQFAVTDIGESSGDTGWFPDGSPAQLRLTGRITGQTTVAMGLSPTACWNDSPDGMKLTAPGAAGTGYLDSEYGAEISLFGQIHTSILGESIDWEGQIPIPFIPTDLLMAGTTTFDPVALANSPVPVVSVTSNPTSPVYVLSTSLLTAFIDIIGISGGLNVSVQGEMTTSYTTNEIDLGGGTITSDGSSVSIDKPEHGFGANLGANVGATGVVHYEPQLIFALNFDVKILGIRVVNYQLAAVTMDLPTIDRPITLTSPDAVIPLPQLGTLPTRLGFATGASQNLTLHNSGFAPLVVEIASPPPGITAQGLTIEPGKDGVIQVTAADPTNLSGAALVLATNDPNYAQVTVALDPSQSGETTEPTIGDQAGGCSTGRGGSPLGFGLALGALAIARRRRAA